MYADAIDVKLKTNNAKSLEVIVVFAANKSINI